MRQEMRFVAVLMVLVLVYCVGGICEQCSLAVPPYPGGDVVAGDGSLNELSDGVSGDEPGEGDAGRRLVVYIISPSGYPDMYPEGLVYFEAFAFGGTPPYRFRWVSDVGGVIGVGGNFAVNLSVNTYEITLEVRDSRGFLVTDNVSVVVIPETPLTVSIVSPEDIVYGLGDSIELVSVVYGGEKPYIVTWMLDDAVVEDIDDVAAGIHRVSFRVTDSLNVSVGDTVEFTVVLVCNINGVCEPGETQLNCPQDCVIPDEPDLPHEGYVVCNRDGVCDLDSENHLNCPMDCPSGWGDGFCDGLRDDICDPDCRGGGDPDCGRSEWFSYLILLFAVLILLAGYFRFIRSK